MHRMHYTEIKDRAIALLQSGAIDGKTFDQIRDGESCVRAWCVRSALDIACREVEQRSPPPPRSVIMRRSDFRKAEFEIKRRLRDWKNDKELTDAY